MAAALLFGTAALADSVIIGNVQNAETKQPVADVVVTATSPNLQGEKVVITDTRGEYRIPQLPPGAYTLRFEKESFKPFSRTEVTLRLDRTVRVNVLLLPEAFTEEIEVVGRPPTVDIGSTTTGINVDQEFIRRIAVNRPGGRGGTTRSFESLAELAPGAQNDAFGVSINGATSPENGYVVDGVSVNDPAFGVNASPLSVEFVQDVNIITGGYMPEYGRSTGGVVNAVTKSGSNEFHGSVFSNWAPGALQGQRQIIENRSSVITGVSDLHNLGDIGATLGGPIMKDKLWFFVGVAPSAQRYQHTRAINAFKLNAAGELTEETEPIPGSESRYFADSRNLQYMGKLTYLINQDHNISLAANGTVNSAGGPGRLTGVPGGALNGSMDSFLSTSAGSNLVSVGLKYAGAFMDKKLLVDANLGYFNQRNFQLPVDGSALGSENGLAGLARFRYRRTTRSLAELEPNVPNIAQFCSDTGNVAGYERCPSVNYVAGGPGFIFDQTLSRFQANAKMTYVMDLLGSHIIKAGVDGEFTGYDQLKAYTGGVFLQETLNGAFWQDIRRYGYQTGPDSPVDQLSQRSFTRSDTLGGFLQDSWTIADRVTLNLGVRYDAQFMYGGRGAMALVLPNQVSPRLGVIVDPLNNGRMKVFGSFSRYYEQVPLNIMDRAFPGENRYSANRYARTASRPTGCDPSTLEGQRGGCRDVANVLPRASTTLNPSLLYGGGKVDNEPVDPNIRPQSSDELSVGGEYEFIANTRLGVNYIRRYMNEVIEDMSRDDGNTYFLGNPGLGFAKDFPRPVRNYDGLMVYVNRNFSDGWLAQVNYTLSRLYGNYPGLFRPENNQLDPNILSDFDLISLLPNRTGLLPFDRTHQVKVFGAREFRFTPNTALSIGLSYRGASGSPISALGAHPLYGYGEAFIIERGSAGRTEWTNNFDANLNFNYFVSKDSSVSFTVDFFNLFNLQGVTSQDSNYTFDAVLPVIGGTAGDLPDKVTVIDPNTNEPAVDDAGNAVPVTVNPNYLQPTAYQAPRQIRFGIRYTF